MKKLSQFSQKIFAISLISMLTIGAGAINAQGNIKATKNNKAFLVKVVAQKSAFNKQQMLINNTSKKQTATGKYADKTPDGRISWNENKNTDYDLAPVTMQMMEKLTLGGKKIALPTTFANLGANYGEFDKFDYLKLKKDEEVVVLENTKNNANLLFESTALKISELKELGFHDFVLRGDLYQKYKYDLAVGLDLENKKIVGLYNSNNYLWATRDLKVDGIGIGSTFNEMYAKFGTPTLIKKQKAEEFNLTTVVYSFFDKNNNLCMIAFHNSDKVFNGREFVATKPNIITEVAVDFRYKNNE